jgi:hypothetical protein
MGVAATQGSIFDWRELGAQVTMWSSRRLIDERMIRRCYEHLPLAAGTLTTYRTDVLRLSLRYLGIPPGTAAFRC